MKVSEIEEKGETSLSSKIWKSSWLILSALMNAISLINIGKDLKVVLISWANFFLLMFDKFRIVSEFLLSPFIHWLKIEIPDAIKHIFIFIFILMTSVSKAMTYSRKYAGINTEQKKENPFVVGIKQIVMIPFTYLYSLFISGVLWLVDLLAGSYVVYFLTLFLIVGIVFLPRTSSYMKTVSLKIRENLSMVVVMVFLIILINYFINTFHST